MDMRNIILGTIAGLAVGMVGALAYSHYLGDGSLVADLQAQLDAANADLAKAKNDKQQLSKETSGATDQVDQLASSNADLRKQLDDLKNAAPAAAAPAVNPVTLAGMMAGMFRGGGFQGQQRMFLLQNRLHLTPDQAAAIKAAMDADGKARRDMGRQLFQGGKIDPQAAASANTLDQTLAKVLTPEQATAYQQVQADEKTSRADTSATTQVNQVAPLLQLSDSQKDQVFSALYQVQMTAPDPASLMTNPNAASIIAAQAQATQAALAKVLTPDQMALYQQEGQTFTAGGFGGRPRDGGNGNGGATTTSGIAPTTSGVAPATTGTGN
jgi:Spy/CpxP family protein refolding chaperone